MSQAGAVSSGGGGTGTDIRTITGNSGGAVPPNAAHNINILGAGTISVVGNPGTNTLTISDAQAVWTLQSTSTTMAANTGYFCVSPGGALVLTLPATSVLGDEIKIALDGATSFSVAQTAGQSIVYGSQSTTAGVGGSLTSTQQGDSLTIVCRTANLRWVAISSVGNLTVV